MKYTKAFLTDKSSANTYRNLKEVIIMSSFEKNLSEGNVAKQLILFSLPFLASNIIQSLYSVADMLIVGGTSLAVYPAAGLIDYYNGNKLVVINNSATPRDKQADLLIQQGLGSVFSQIEL